MSNPQTTLASPRNADAAARPALTMAAGVVGIVIVTAFTVGWAPAGGFLAQSLAGRLPPSVAAEVFSDIAKCGLAAVLALVAFGVAKRRPAFYGMRRMTRQDVIAILKTLCVLFATVSIFRLIQGYPSSTAPGPIAGSIDELPLVYGLLGAVVAGLTEEFVYRGYLIEELSALNRTLAAGASVVAFGLAHVRGGYGWSIELFYPILSGIAFTALYLWRRNLWACVSMHVAMDALYAILHAV